MNLWIFFFGYLYKGYRNFGEKASGHIATIVVLSVFLSCNALTLMFFFAPKAFTHSTSFEIMMVFLYGVLLIANATYFLKSKRYLEWTITYEKMDSIIKRKYIFLFWFYVSVSLFLLILSMI